MGTAAVHHVVIASKKDPPVGKNEDGAVGDVDLGRGVAGREGCIPRDHHQLVAGACTTTYDLSWLCKVQLI